MKASKKPAPEAPPHLVFYGRVSTDEQSLELQQHAADRYGIPRDQQYYDHGKSGANIERDGLNAALKACRPAEHGRPASKLVVWKLDRVARNLRDLVMLADALRERGVELVSLTEYFDTSTAIGKFTFHLLASLAQFERDLTLERTMAGLRVAAEMGRRGGAPRAFEEPKGREIARAYWKRGKNVSHRDHVKAVGRRFKITEQSVYNYRDRFPDEKPADAPEPDTALWRQNVRRLANDK